MTPLQATRFLNKHIPPEIAEVLLPVITWRTRKNGLTAILPNPIWEDVFIRYAAPPLHTHLQTGNLQLIYRCPVVEDHSPKQQTFSNFLHDPGNEFAVSACLQIIESPGIEHNPLFLYGPHGCGKSHLMHAVHSDYSNLLGEDAVLHLNGPQFVNRDAHILAERVDNSLRQRIESAALICFDNVDALAKRNLAQEELFHLINNCLENGQQFLFTASCVPHKLDIEERLGTRLGWGLSIGIESPLTETRIAYLRQRAGDAMNDIDPEGLAEYVSTHAPDMSAIEDLATRIIHGEDVLHTENLYSFDTILEAVALHFNVRTHDIIGKRRTRAITHARQTTLMLARRLTQHKLEALGGMVGGRDHSTVIYSIREAEKRVNTNKHFAEDIQQLTRIIHSQSS